MEKDLIAQRRAKKERWPKVFPGYPPDRFEGVTDPREIREAYDTDDWTAERFEAEEIRCRTAGRLMAKRKMGKLTFGHIASGGIRLQVLFERGRLEDLYPHLSLLDVGDLIGVEGHLMRTRTGELTVNVHTLMPLQKCLRPLPEKWHGLRDVEQRFRQRYLDMIMNPETTERFLFRSRLIRSLREFMGSRGYEEVETPMLHSLIGGAAARPFVTHHNALDMELYLRIAPELYLKRLVVGGFPRVYEINRNFRNEGLDTHHNPEFTMLECYEAYASAADYMGFTEDLLCHAEAHTPPPGGEEEPPPRVFAKPFPRLDLRSAAREALAERGIREEDWAGAEARERIAPDLEMSRGKVASEERFLVEAFETLVAPRLEAPTFVMNFPLEVSPLSRRKPDSEDTVDRFELYVQGMEICNGFSELNDPDDQRSRFRDQVRAKARGQSETMDYDEDYCTALEYGLPPAAGLGVGIDRLTMLLSRCPSIREVILFPLLKDSEGPENGKGKA